MKKGIVFLILVATILFLVNAPRVLAISSTVNKTSVQSVDYKLPYPGILPDSPFYFFKIIRDWAQSNLIPDQVDRSFYLLFLADKRVAAAEQLDNRGKIQLSAVTAMQAEECLVKASDLAGNISKSSFRRNDLLAKLLVSSAKHEQVLRSLFLHGSLRELGIAWQDNQVVRSRITDLVMAK